MKTSYDTSRSLALQYLSAMFRVPFKIVDDLRRDPCARCNEIGNVTTARVCGDSDTNTSWDQVECCISCLPETITKAYTELRSGADVHVEVPSRLLAFEGDLVELHAGTKCMRTLKPLTAERYFVVEQPVAGFLLVRPQGDPTSEPSAIRFKNVALICAGVPSV